MLNILSWFSQCFTLEFTKANILFPWIRRIISYKITNNYCIKYVSPGILLLQQKTWENNPYKEQGLTIDVWLLTKDKKRWLDNAKFFIYIYICLWIETQDSELHKKKRTGPIPCHLDWTSMVKKGFIIMVLLRIHFSCGT